MPALPSCLTDPIWAQVKALIPHPEDHHPLGCHRPRVPDRVVLNLLIIALMCGAGYRRIADARCSATTLRRRRDEWIAAGVMDRLEQLARDGYDKMIGLQLADVAVDGCLTKAPCGDEVAGRNPTHRGKLGSNAPPWSMPAGYRWGWSARRRTGTTPRCWARPWTP